MDTGQRDDRLTLGKCRSDSHLQLSIGILGKRVVAQECYCRFHVSILAVLRINMPVIIASFVFQGYQTPLAAAIKKATEVLRTTIRRFLPEANAAPY
jgi:hypothetical protein